MRNLGWRSSRIVGQVMGESIAGGLIAGSLGSWRAARLRPAAALAKVE